jgi:ADP-heptose:LPS heptosyltransferase
MRRVLVARLDSVGDVLLAGPAVRAVAAGRDGVPTEVSLLCGPQGAPAARRLPGVARVLE